MSRIVTKLFGGAVMLCLTSTVAVFALLAAVVPQKAGSTSPAEIKGMWITTFVALGVVATMANFRSRWKELAAVVALTAVVLVVYATKHQFPALHAYAVLSTILVPGVVLSLMSWMTGFIEDEHTRARETALFASVAFAVAMLFILTFWSIVAAVVVAIGMERWVSGVRKGEHFAQASVTAAAG